MGIIQSVFLFLRAFIIGRTAVAVENLALRQQVAVFEQSVKPPSFPPDEFFGKDSPEQGRKPAKSDDFHFGQVL
jgi:hypothetical protein